MVAADDHVRCAERADTGRQCERCIGSGVVDAQGTGSPGGEGVTQQGLGFGGPGGDGDAPAWPGDAQGVGERALKVRIRISY